RRKCLQQSAEANTKQLDHQPIESRGPIGTEITREVTTRASVFRGHCRGHCGSTRRKRSRRTESAAHNHIRREQHEPEKHACEIRVRVWTRSNCCTIPPRSAFRKRSDSRSHYFTFAEG